MRTPRRQLAFVATIATALLGGGLIAGATPAAAAAQTISDCTTNSVGDDGMLDAGLLQACLNQVQAARDFDVLGEEVSVAEEVADEPAAVEAPVVDLSGFDALDVVFGVDDPEVSAGSEPAAPAYDGLGGDFAALRECESGGNYSINTGNGYYGAYQFALSTWQGLGYEGYPHHAPPEVQDQAARELQALYGWGQ